MTDTASRFSLKVRMQHAQIIQREKEILGGKPVFTGTRVPVDSLIDHLKAGDSLDDFLDDFPTVRREQATRFLELAQAALLAQSTPENVI